jgi:hypothetical protein
VLWGKSAIGGLEGYVLLRVYMVEGIFARRLLDFGGYTWCGVVLGVLGMGRGWWVFEVLS